MRSIKGLLLACALILPGCTGTPDAEDIADSVAADPDHYSVEFENEAVRVVRVAYGPGETSVMHGHPALCSVTLAPTSWRMTEADGSVAESSGAAGEFSCSDASVHLPENTGSSPNEVILIELNEDAMPGGATMEEQGAVAASPEHYSVEFENAAVRVLRIRYDAGESGVLHSHPANCVVWLSGSDAEGEASSPGQTQCSDAQTHTPAGSPDGVVELIAVEFKGRASLEG